MKSDQISRKILKMLIIFYKKMCKFRFCKEMCIFTINHNSKTQHFQSVCCHRQIIVEQQKNNIFLIKFNDFDPENCSLAWAIQNIYWFYYFSLKKYCFQESFCYWQASFWRRIWWWFLCENFCPKNLMIFPFQLNRILTRSVSYPLIGVRFFEWNKEAFRMQELSARQF